MDQLAIVSTMKLNAYPSEQPSCQIKEHGNTILVIERDPTLLRCRSEVLMKTNFCVHATDPLQARELLAGSHSYGLVVLSHTLLAEEILQFATQVRARHTRAKLLLLLGPDRVSFNPNTFDATLEGLDGPAALVGMVQKLLAPEDPVASRSFVL